jgi:hypothetical protein
MHLPRFAIWQWMVTVVVVALSIRYLGIVGTIELLVLSLLAAVPIVFATCGKRLRASAWVAAIYSTFPLLSLYLFWLIGWFYLGHAPRPSLDDPRGLASRITGPMEVLLIGVLGLPVSILSNLLLTALSAEWEWGPDHCTAYDFAPMSGMGLAWLGVASLLALDPLSVFGWLMD